MAEQKAPEPYKHQEFPKLVYHETEGHKAVASKEEQTAALKDGYSLTPFPPKPAVAEKEANSAVNKRLEKLEAKIEEIEEQLADAVAALKALKK